MNQQSDHELRKFKQTAEDIVRDTRSIILTGIAQGFSYHLKPDGSFVTDIDLAVEDLIRSRLRAAFPDHGILGEERPEIFAESDYRWIIDPVDGTRSLRHRIPLFGTLLALRHGGRSIVGVIDLPALDKTYVAASGLGAHCNGQQIQLEDVASKDAIDFEVIAVGEREQFVQREKAAAFDSLMSSHSSVRTYCDCFGHALAIEGCVGAMVDYNLRIWDVAATEILIQEVGGKYVRVNAKAPRDTAEARYDVVFGKPTVVEWLLSALGAEADG